MPFELGNIKKKFLRLILWIRSVTDEDLAVKLTELRNRLTSVVDPDPKKSEPFCRNWIRIIGSDLETKESK